MLRVEYVPDMTAMKLRGKWEFSIYLAQDQHNVPPPAELAEDLIQSRNEVCVMQM